MNSNYLKHFVAVAEHGSFTQAAHTLNIAQPPLSISIKKLEQELGLTLFLRKGRQVSLTLEGEVLYKHAKQVQQSLEDTKTAMEELRGLDKGEVRLGVPSMMGSYYFPEILMAFKSRYPNLKLTVINAGTRSIRQMLLDGTLDIGVINHYTEAETLETDHLLTSNMVAAVGKQHPLAQHSTISLKEFFQHELVLFEAGYFHRDFIEKKAQEYGMPMHFSFETNLLPLILSIVKNEFAITALLDMVTDYEKDVVAIPFDESVELNLALAWRKNGYLSIAHRTFIEFVKQNR
ncbi:LysR family transcriptional regulator [Vibrio agarivorans]|uniref:LysR family transcriptional regulator n=1 Tax=Vibrio agarivorans TaxID=153622 RepID=UPI00223023BC|nr:LysR family transcriptional regulator [Vibrio agarivorans]